MSSLSSQEEIIIFVSCIGGVLGFMFIIAFLGFCWEQCKSARSRRNPNTRNNLYLNKQAPPVHVNTITNSHAHDANCHNHYPSWMFDTMVSEQVRNMRNYVEISEKDDPHRDPVHYINEVFSDIYEEDEAFKEKELAISYEKTNKLIKPERKPAVPVPYYKDNSLKNKEENEKEKIKISMENEFVEPHKEEKSHGKFVPMDDIDLDLDLFEMGDSGSEKETTKILITQDLLIEEKIKAGKQQLVEYENPAILEKERKEKRREFEEMEKNKAKRIAMDMSQGFSFGAAMSEFAQEAKKKASKEVVFDTVEENQSKDSFLY